MKKKLALLLCFLCLFFVQRPVDAASHFTGEYISTTRGLRPYCGLTIFPDAYNKLNDMLVECNGCAGKYLLALWPSLAHSSTNFQIDTSVSKNGKNEIFTVKEGREQYVGVSYIISDKSTGIVQEFDINFNMRHPFSVSGDSSSYDLQTIFLHEAGHVIGLEDEDNDSTFVMYPYGPPGTIKRAFSLMEKLYIKSYYKNK